MSRVVSFLTVLFLAGAMAWASPEDVRSLIEDANAAYAEGAAKLSSDRDAAAASFRRSADLYRLAAEGGAASGPLMYNLGNASFLAGDMGQAILWYKRAERVMPNDANVRANLAKARERVGAPPAPVDPLMEQFTILEFVPPSVRFWGAAAALSAMWGLAFWRLIGTGWRPSRLGVGLCAAGAILAGGSLIPRELRLREPTEAVLLVETTGRAGPDATAYEPKPASPLKSGTEVRIIEERGGWLLVELGDTTRTWVKGKGVERVGR